MEQLNTNQTMNMTKAKTVNAPPGLNGIKSVNVPKQMNPKLSLPVLIRKQGIVWYLKILNMYLLIQPTRIIVLETKQTNKLVLVIIISRGSLNSLLRYALLMD